MAHTFQRNSGGGAFSAFAPMSGPQEGGLASPKVVISATGTNATLVKGEAGEIFGITMGNSTASWAYLKLYDKATAPVPGTDTPVAIYGIPPATGAGLSMTFSEHKLQFNNGIGFAITGGVAANDATAVAANIIMGTIAYR